MHCLRPSLWPVQGKLPHRASQQEVDLHLRLGHYSVISYTMLSLFIFSEIIYNISGIIYIISVIIYTISVIIYIICVIIYTILILGCGFFSHCVGEVLGIATCRACGHTNTGTEFGFHLCIRCLTMQYTSQGPSCGPAGVAASSASVRPCLRL